MDVLKLLSRLVEIDTTNDPARDKKPSIDCARFIRDWLNERDLPADILESQGYYSVYGVIGNGKPVIMLLAHYDTVPVIRDEWVYEPLRLTVINGKAYGRGVLDDKGNVSAIMTALSRISNRVRDFTVVYAFTGDEETGGFNGARIVRDKLIREGLKPDYVINGDGQGLIVVTKRRNRFIARLKVNENIVSIKGKKLVREFSALTSVYKTRHAAYFLPGVDKHPLIEASHYLRTYDLYIRSIEGPFVKDNVIPSNVKVEFVKEDATGEYVEVDLALTRLIELIVPLTRCSIEADHFSEYGITVTPNFYSYLGGQHILDVDIRAMTLDIERVRRSIMNILRNLDLKVELEVKGGAGYLYTPAESVLVKTALKALRKIGLRPKVGELPEASDSRYFSLINADCIDIGPIGENMHGADESIEVWSLKKLIEFYELVPLTLRESY